MLAENIAVISQTLNSNKFTVRADDSQFGFKLVIERAQLDHVQLNGIGQKKLIAAGSPGNEIQKINLFLIEVVGVVGHRLAINSCKGSSSKPRFNFGSQELLTVTQDK